MMSSLSRRGNATLRGTSCGQARRRWRAPGGAEAPQLPPSLPPATGARCSVWRTGLVRSCWPCFWLLCVCLNKKETSYFHVGREGGRDRPMAAPVMKRLCWNDTRDFTGAASRWRRVTSRDRMSTSGFKIKAQAGSGLSELQTLRKPSWANCAFCDL